MVKKYLWVDSEAIRTNSYRFFLREDCGCSFDLCEYGEDIIEKSRTKYDAAFFYLYRIGFQTDELPEDFPFEAPEVYRNGIYVYNNFVKNPQNISTPVFLLHLPGRNRIIEYLDSLQKRRNHFCLSKYLKLNAVRSS